MINRTANNLLIEREEFSDEERQLFESDLKDVCEEYFEGSGRYSLNVTKSANGYSICILFTARRIKSFKKPK
jgi:hypothetical protein